MEQAYNLLYVGNSLELLEPLQNDASIKLTIKDNALQAMHYIEEAEVMPDGIICNMILRGINGVQFYKELKLKKYLAVDVPFILVSRNFKQSFRQQAYSLGVDDYFAAPFQAERITNRIDYISKFKTKYSKEINQDTESSLEFYKTPFLKRAFDISLAGGALLALSPLMLITCVAIYAESRGKVFYASKRVGANFKTFDFYKFRSMYPDADKRLKEVAHLNQYQSVTVEENCSECAKLPEGEYCSPTYDDDKGDKICERMIKIKRSAEVAFLKIENDPRITKVGKFIRNTSIDELPQLINIIKGDMSIVGNRPLPVSEANALTKSARGKRLELGLRFNCAAGLTGLWQVELRGKAGGMSEDERFELDKAYALDNSFIGDIKLILRTFKVFLKNENV
jgi:lipopolysaccharide/colanic/teichoic acid biosynthesis glycosyltransferase